ncbi:MAG: 4a-hydroxytetrahydrobiopterin dehydratase [Ignavibacteria bacterium]|nr:4a-hydroxytetrahydrobiopterin dehydratase [Ignavibacteria bacterium]MBT8383036.1 4a-hydroxytetrahydrobiopterin dehydratase [Ignavibacteria bacterium]MBT8391860.1 4a-hydroxytetrahydrobiopterin dehydratase [Ignavibacteria bacterium]NNJ53972.1 4a-hydroxytetrahydrobiopterin dehydratase [Ignavibacteriaceae bacterium]NNL21493.1 4a-hydroxytetrahydrobiopterin dehydratase [Ignavibacteriaceae bacterium]
MAVLNDSEIKNKLASITGWNFSSNQIGKEYQLKDFAEALSFVNKIGAIAEEMNHHPHILMHSWNKVKITVSTHSEGGVTEKDFQLAVKLENI